MRGGGLGILVAIAAALGLVGISSASPAATAKLTVQVAGRGTVTSFPKGIACPKACTKAFPKGRKVNLTPKAAPGWAFTGWTGACAKAKQACTLAMTGSKKTGAVFTAKAPPTPPPQPTGFTPQALAGTWSGTWRNETFGSSGPASIVMTVVNQTTFTFMASFGGNVFGCSSPPPAPGTVTQGSGPNTWNASGFNVDTTTPAGGRVTLTYVHATSSMTGNGTSGCNPAITWQMASGTFSGTTFTGRIAIALAGAPLATSVLILTRS